DGTPQQRNLSTRARPTVGHVAPIVARTKSLPPSTLDNVRKGPTEQWTALDSACVPRESLPWRAGRDAPARTQTGPSAIPLTATALSSAEPNGSAVGTAGKRVDGTRVKSRALARAADAHLSFPCVGTAGGRRTPGDSPEGAWTHCVSRR